LVQGGELFAVNSLQEILRRLYEIERAVGVLDSLSVRKLVIEVQDFVLESQKESVRMAGLSETQTETSR
jgi:hypothetical protein